ncbi:accessory Sec system protein Asp2 [Enterococcus gallinarum]|uniref:accessory Sec system protein Asp2 n=1 Tax=Enterococcus gallinarum TaxID=1353 RepID=UPI000E3EF85B|nr:accessory Sec system protein Asp2 [Enterococcus gallinarum]RGC48416.1 accessory Sec system protein Asp2 [Enterococcus gallinarum]
MASSKQIKIFHIAAAAVSSEWQKQLSSLFVYQWLPLAYDFRKDEQELQLFEKDKYNSKYHRALFLLEKDALILEDKELLEQLPAYQIFYEKNCQLSPEVQALFTLKAAKLFDEQQLENVFSSINEQFSAKQQGYKLSMDHMKFNKDVSLQITKKGHAACQVKAQLTPDYQQITTWKMTNLIPKEERTCFYPEIANIQGEAILKIKLFFIKENTNQVIQVIEIAHDRIINGDPIYFKLDQQAYINVSLYAKGNQGQFTIGQMHLRRAMADESVMIPGGGRIRDDEHLGGEVIYYFNPGDLKPPLAVYFSGYRSAEGFEGRGMMGSMGCPFLLIGDPRLEGGNFYLGSQKFEQEIVTIILEKLALLGFQKSDLILSGLSMGTFGALYYASDLSPNSVIVGKPLTNLGSIALNERINRPTGFPTSLDMLLYNIGFVSEEASSQLNGRFWEKFKSGDYRQTTFAIAYMKQDDYDMEAFPMLFEFLKNNFPMTRVLYKGMIGRHNDNSPAINNWFLKQYKNILVHKFHRNIKKIL